MDEEKSIPELKLKQMFTETSDRLHDLEKTKPDPTEYKYSPVGPDGTPRNDFLKDAHRQYSYNRDRDFLFKVTEARFQDFQKNAKAEHRDYYNSIYDEWKKNPDAYRTPEIDNMDDRSENETVERREVFTENTKVVEDARPDNKYVRMYNQSLHFTNVDAGAGTDPSKVKEDVEPDDPDI